MADDATPQNAPRRKRRKRAKVKQAAGNPIVRILTTDLVLRAGSYVLRQGVRHGLVRGSTADKVPDHPPTMTTRVATAAASAIATRSVPGALLIGGGLVLRTLYRRGLARRAARTGEQVLPPS